MQFYPSISMRAGIALSSLVFAATQSAYASDVPNPTVVGPVPVHAEPGDPSHDYVFFTPQQDLADYGYVEEEFFMEGTASTYDTSGAKEGTVTSGDHPYRTRLVVRRPAATSDFNGTVLLEWQNVSAGYETDAHWAPSWDHLIAGGYAWIGVSAQRVGVHGNTDTEVNNGLRAWSPTRYGSLDVTDNGEVTDDGLCYDIFSQAAKAVRSPTTVDVLGGLAVKEVIAIGASQSASRLSVYHNAIHPLHEVVDAFYLLVGGSGLRTDLDVKVFQFLSETDLGRGPTRRMADSAHFRSWEVAGSAHSSFFSDIYRSPLTIREFGARQFPPDCDQPPFSRVRSYFVINHQYDLLVRWLRQGTPPPVAPKLEFTDDVEAPLLVRDAYGIARGGIRLPEVDVPTALQSGANSGAAFCLLYGTYQPFTREQLQQLYPSKRDYVRQVRRVARRNAEAGYISQRSVWRITLDALREDLNPSEEPSPPEP